MFEVKIKVDNEAELYNPFDPEEQMINGDIIDYIFEKIMEKEIRDKLLRLMLSGRVPELLSEIVSTVGAFSTVLAIMLLFDPFEHFEMHMRILGLEMIVSIFQRRHNIIREKREG